MAGDGTLEQALKDCHDAVKDSAHLAIDDNDLDNFVGLFTPDFRKVLGPHPEKWIQDKPRVTALARAIGALAEFVALHEGAEKIRRSHLEKSFEYIHPACPSPKVARPGRQQPMVREYCAGLPLVSRA